MSRRILRWGSAAFVAVAGGFALWFLASHRADVSRLVREAAPGTLLLSLLLLVSFVVVQGALGALVLRATGTDAPLSGLLRLILVSWLGKYVPGKVWVITARLAWLSRRAVAPEVVLAGSVVEHAFMLSTGAVVFLATSAGHASVPEAWGRGALVLAALGVLAFVLAPGTVQAAGNALLRALRRPAIARWPSRGQGALLFAGYCGTWLLVGLGVHALTASLVPGLPWSAWLPLTGAFALSVCAGFLAVFAPAGLGVREAVFVLGLAPYATPVEAVFVAVAARLVFTAAEALALGAAVGLPRLVAGARGRPDVAGEERP